MAIIAPGRWRLGRQPAIGTASVLAIRNAFKGENSAIQIAAHLAILGIGNRRRWGAAISRILTRADLGTVGGLGGSSQRDTRRRGKSKGGAATDRYAIIVHDFLPQA